MAYNSHTRRQNLPVITEMQESGQNINSSNSDGGLWSALVRHKFLVWGCVVFVGLVGMAFGITFLVLHSPNIEMLTPEGSVATEMEEQASWTKSTTPTIARTRTSTVKLLTTVTVSTKRTTINKIPTTTSISLNKTTTSGINSTVN